MRALAFALAAFLGHAGLAAAAAEVDRDRLVGSWSLVAYQLAYEGEPPSDVFGCRRTISGTWSRALSPRHCQYSVLTDS